VPRSFSSLSFLPTYDLFIIISEEHNNNNNTSKVTYPAVLLVFLLALKMDSCISNNQSNQKIDNPILPSNNNSNPNGFVFISEPASNQLPFTNSSFLSNQENPNASFFP